MLAGGFTLSGLAQDKPAIPAAGAGATPPTPPAAKPGPKPAPD